LRRVFLYRYTDDISLGMPRVNDGDDHVSADIKRRLDSLKRLVDRPGTPGEAAAAQAAIDRIKATHQAVVSRSTSIRCSASRSVSSVAAGTWARNEAAPADTAQAGPAGLHARIHETEARRREVVTAILVMLET
jgi:hypothetical protein